MPVSSTEFREAMARLSAHVTIVTAYDSDGRPRGFTATAVSSLSMEPPLILTCISRTALCHNVLVQASSFAVNVLRDSHQDLAQRFATPGIDRFAGIGFHRDPRAPHLPDALSVLTCSVHATHPGGDHTILVGQVEGVSTSHGDPLLYFDRKFCGLSLASVL